MKELSRKRQRFVEEYLIDFNGKQAAIRAGYSPKSAEMQASRLLSKAKVAAAVDDGRALLAERSTVKAEDVLRELAKLAFANMEDYTKVGEDGQRGAVDLSSLTRDQMAAVNEISYDAAGRLKFKLADKRAALVDLGKHLGLFTDKQLIKLEGSLSHDWTVRVVPANGAVTHLPDAQLVDKPRARRLPELAGLVEPAEPVEPVEPRARRLPELVGGNDA